MDNIEFIYSLFNQFLFQDAKNNIEQIEYFVKTSPNLSSNKFVFELVNSIRNFSFDSIDIPLFQSILSKTGKSPEESQKVMGEITKWKSFSKDQIKPAKELLQQVIASTIISKANGKFINDPYKFIKYIKESEIKVSSESNSKVINFADIDVTAIEAESIGNVYPSFHEWINNTFAPINGYRGKQLVMVSMPPGTGKSLFLCGEAISILTKTSARVYILCMGDMDESDYVIRMGAILSGQSFYYASTHLKEMKSMLDHAFGRRLVIEIADPGEINVDDFLEKMKVLSPNVFMVDYDANFEVNLGSDGNGMYTEFGDLYNKLVKITKDTGALGFVAAQPTKNSWGLEVINEDQVGESAKKIHTVDVCITAGVNVKSQNPIGILKMAKNRRGEKGREVPYIRLNNGRFFPLNRDVYRQISEIQEKKDFTEAELNNMLSMSKAAYISSQQPQQIQNRVDITNPFISKK